MDIDKLNSVDPAQVRQVGQAIADKLQDYAPADQVAGAAAFFILLCDAHSMHPGNAMHTAGRVMRGDEGTRHRQFEALGDYIRGEGLDAWRTHVDEFDMMDQVSITPVYRRAVRILKSGEPLPVDLFMELTELGVDAEALINNFDDQ